MLLTRVGELRSKYVYLRAVHSSAVSCTEFLVGHEDFEPTPAGQSREMSTISTASTYCTQLYAG